MDEKDNDDLSLIIFISISITFISASIFLFF
jgi:hypothetical protein